jgi:Icc protein
MSVFRHQSYNLDSTAEVVRIVQLTDTHLCREPGGTLLGMNTDHSLRVVIELVKAQRQQVDLILGTGDLADGGARQAYERVQAAFSTLDAPQVWIPGNHDLRSAMEEVADSPQRMCGELRAGNWQILLLDSQIEGEVGGRLGEQELAFLDSSLARAARDSVHSLVCLHHQPVPVGCDWLDEQMVEDSEAFFEVLDRYESVRAVLWGHVHQEIDETRGSVRLLASPSTCVQFAPGSVDFLADQKPPGYRWLDLYADGRLETGVARVDGADFVIDLDAGGYL